MKLVFVHGRAQEAFDPPQLKEDWVNTWKRGVEKSGLPFPSDVIIEFPYYGKLLKNLTDEARTTPVTAGVAKRSGDILINESKEIEFFEAFLGELSEGLATNQVEKRQVKDMQQTKRGPLNWEAVHWFLAFLDKKQTLGELALKKFTLDVFLYLTIPKIKTQVNEAVLQSFTTEPCVVVGHSLGSVVSYLILRDNPQFQVKKFITLGSPLGSATIGKHLGGTKMPACVQNGWFNAYDERDVVALNPLNKKHFNVSPPIENKNDVDNHTGDRHGIAGYLDDAVVAKKIYDALI